MGKLSFQPYILKCILGAEIFYVLCRLYPYVLKPEARALHDSLWEIAIPGFVPSSVSSLLWGAVYVAALAVFFGAYMVWMHNSSLKK